MKISNEQLDKLQDFHFAAMIEIGPDRHTDGSRAMVYGILKLLGIEFDEEHAFFTESSDEIMTEIYARDKRWVDRNLAEFREGVSK